MVDNLNLKELDYQYSKIIKYLKNYEDKIKKYKKYKNQLYNCISKKVLEDNSIKDSFPSLTIEIKQNEKFILNDNTIFEFFQTIYPDKPKIYNEIMERFKKYKETKLKKIKQIVNISLC